MAKLADALESGSNVERRDGSSPFIPTIEDRVTYFNKNRLFFCLSLNFCSSCVTH